MARWITKVGDLPIELFDDELVEAAGRRLGMWVGNGAPNRTHVVDLSPDNGTRYVLLVTHVEPEIEAFLGGPFVVSWPGVSRSATIHPFGLPTASGIQAAFRMEAGIADAAVLERLFFHAYHTTYPSPQED